MTPTATSSLFDSVPDDYMMFGRGESFNVEAFEKTLGLTKEDIPRVVGMSAKIDDAIPQQMRERIEEIANTMNMVAMAFNGDVGKAVTWFKVSNPLLGDVCPRDMIRLGRYERLRKFIVNAMIERRPAMRAAPLQPA